MVLMISALWVEPGLVGQVAFSEWTTDGELRHPRFQGLWDDKLAELIIGGAVISTEVTDEAGEDGGNEAA